MNRDLLYGALLHDIGKLISRAISDEGVRTRFRHQELGVKWAEEVGLGNVVVEIIRRHHSLSSHDAKYVDLSVDAFQGDTEVRNCIHAVAEADNIAAGMERGNDRRSGSFQRDVPLRSVFDLVDIRDGIGGDDGQGPRVDLNGSAGGRFYGTRSTFWETKPLTEFPYPGEWHGVTVADYAALWKGFREEFDTLRNSLKGLPEEETLLTLLQKYTFTIPEHTYVGDEFPDTSLYHHLKTTASIAYCTYLYLTKEKGYDWRTQDLSAEIGDRRTARYLLIAADFSGIQDFIYTLSSKGALRTLRGRSFYLNFMQESVATQFLDRFGLPRSCIIYVGGGGFYLIAPNLTEIKDNIERLRDDINRVCFEEFGTSIFMAMAFAEVTGEDLHGSTDGLREAWGGLKMELSKQKGQKWHNLFAERFADIFEPVEPPERTCASCHSPLQVRDGQGVGIGASETEPGFDLCPFCRKMATWGRELARIEAVYEVDPGTKDLADPGYIRCGGYWYSYRPRPRDIVRRVYLVRDPWNLQGYDRPVLNLFQGTYYTQPDLNLLVEESTGIKRIGVLRMDVDSLGRIFSRGLPANKATFARMNDLSERLNLYFNYYLPKVLGSDWPDKLLPGQGRKLGVNLVYSGGDDLFLVGTWDSALEAAWRVYSDFRRFVGGNPSITLSGGLIFADEKVSFHKLAQLAGEAEGKAKHEGRNRLTLFGRAYRWDQVKPLGKRVSGAPSIAELLAVFEPVIEWRNGNSARPAGFSKAFLHKLQFFAERFATTRDLWLIPRLHYAFARMMSAPRNREYRPFYRSLLAVMLNQETLACEMLPTLQIVDYLLRGDGGE